jgi:hypothetical protein
LSHPTLEGKPNVNHVHARIEMTYMAIAQISYNCTVLECKENLRILHTIVLSLTLFTNLSGNDKQKDSMTLHKHLTRGSST